MLDDEGQESESTEQADLGSFSVDHRFNFKLPEPERERAHDSDPDKTTEAMIGEAPDTPPLDFSKDPDVDPLIGQSIGNYTILEHLGRGGFGTVYKARDHKLDRMAALKFLRFPLDPEYRDSFSREAKIIANLGKHPSIVQIYTWGEFRGSRYFALEYLDTSAQNLLATLGKPLPVPQALKIAASCASGLHFAHEQGVLHRDVKPANILIDKKSGDAKLCDFGLAKFQNFGSGVATATIAGSPPYMAPEQINGKTMDGRTDVYALGVTLYEMVSRRLPCEGSSHSEVFERIRSSKSTPLEKFRPDLPKAVLNLIKKATAHRPENRFQTAEEMGLALRAILDGLESSGTAELPLTHSPTHVTGRTAKTLMVSAAAAAVALIIWGASVGFRDSSAPKSGDSLWPAALASAKDQIEEGSYEEALLTLDEHLDEHPDDDWGRYALGYANLLMNGLDDADRAFGAIGADDELRKEGEASVAHARDGEGSRTVLEQALDSVSTRYPGLLLASLDVAVGEYERAIARLEDIHRAGLYFQWQREQYSRLLGQAFFKSGNFSGAEATFALLPDDDAFAAGYLELARRQDERESREDRSKRIKDLRALWDSMDVVDRQDLWTSRPFAFSLFPSDGEVLPLAVTLGLPDLFPIGLAGAIREPRGVPLELVNRDDIDAILEELQLSGSLSREEETLQGRLVGARLLMELSFMEMQDGTKVIVQVTDTERSTRVLSADMEFDSSDTFRTISERIVARLIGELQRDYPLQGLLKSDGRESKINIGTSVGVRPGMRFAVLTSEKASPLPEKFVRATDRVGESETIVELSGLKPRDIQDGLFVRLQEPL